MDLPWIITIGPLGDDEDWEPVLCGPYERAHALAMARAIVLEEELMAVVEPVQPRVSVERIRADVTAARTAALDDAPPAAEGVAFDAPVTDDVPDAAQVRAGLARIAQLLVAA